MDLKNVTTTELLEELASRGGHPAALAQAAILCINKSRDYNQEGTEPINPHTVDRSEFFPFGTLSYAQMIVTKALRFQRLTMKKMSNMSINFEGLRDTALDIINYAGFYLAFLDKED